MTDPHAPEDKALYPELTPSPSERLLRFFEYAHLPEGELRTTSKACREFAYKVQANIPDGPEKTVGLRKLLEAKDCFVRACLK